MQFVISLWCGLYYWSVCDQSHVSRCDPQRCTSVAETQVVIGPVIIRTPTACATAHNDIHEASSCVLPPEDRSEKRKGVVFQRG